jgi:DNA invertase Pin-like site-specific DNA recombinase
MFTFWNAHSYIDYVSNNVLKQVYERPIKYVWIYEQEGVFNIYYGYHRTSTLQQHLDRGISEIKEYCNANGIYLEKVYTDQLTGKNFNRPRYTVLRDDILRNGDCLIITELDRLGRNKQDTLKELQYLRDKGVRVMILEIPTTLQDLTKLDNSMAQMIMETINNMLIELYAAMAQAEIEKKEKRQREGIQAKKVRGEWDEYGRPHVEKPNNWNDVIDRWKAGEITAVKAIELTGVKKTKFYKLAKTLK